MYESDNCERTDVPTQEMPKYIGTKILQGAIPMTRKDFFINQGKAFPKDTENEEGYLVKYEDGYESWSPKNAFEKAYRRTDNMNLGLAIEALKKGYKVARKGWNGKGMWLQYVPGSDFEFSEMLPYIAMKTVQNSFVPWLASQTDMLADDWIII